MGDEDDVQDWDALVLRRVRKFLDPALIGLGDLVPDGGLLKVVKDSCLQNGDTEALVTFVEGTPGDQHVVYVAGRDTLVWRLADDG